MRKKIENNNNIMRLIRENFVWAKDIAMVCGMCGVLYLNLNYVTNSKFDAFASANSIRFESVQSAIISLDKSLALLQQNNKILSDNQEEIIHINSILNDMIQQAKEDSRIAEIAKNTSSKFNDHVNSDNIKAIEVNHRLTALELFIKPK